MQALTQHNDCAPKTGAAVHLAQMNKGFCGVIHALNGPSFYVERLRELGFIAGEKICVLGRAPFGEPLFIEIRGATIALRRAEASCILL